MEKPPLSKVLLQIIRPFQAFFQTESASGILLLLATALALLFANSSLAEGYQHFFEQTLSLSIGGHGLSLSLRHWVNEALMAVFFFLVGMEIKRELVVGELSSFGRAILPLIAALGGMIFPAGIYALLNAGGPGGPGFGIPTATDIAFSLGCIAALRSRVPASLAVFLAALAIFDDLGAIVVIALFYGQDIHLTALLYAALLTGALFLMNRLGARSLLAYLIVGFLLWLVMLESGIHATLAGVILGLAIPARPLRDPKEAVSDLDLELDRLKKSAKGDEDSSAILAAIERHFEAIQSPLARLVNGLHGVVAFGIVPLFAFANAGVALSALSASDVASPVSLGVILGLFFGKQAGVFLFTRAAVALGLSPMPSGARWLQVYGVAILAGIGFTMSLFVAELAFPASPALNSAAKIGILIGSGLSAFAGLLFLRLIPLPEEGANLPQKDEEPEAL